jgi:hypothetical protein
MLDMERERQEQERSPGMERDIVVAHNADKRNNSLHAGLNPGVSSLCLNFDSDSLFFFHARLSRSPREEQKREPGDIQGYL